MDAKLSDTALQDNRIMAALAHAGILVPMMGLIAPIFIWVTQREKSRYVRFQALQATVYHLALVLLYFAGMACYMLSIFAMIGFGGVVEATGGPGGDMMGLGMVLPFLVIGGLMLFGLAMLVGGVVGAVQCLRGRDFRYPLIGDWLERRYPSEPLAAG